MKYLFVIAMIVCIVTGLTLFFSAKQTPLPLDKTALIINGHAVSQETVDKDKFSYHDEKQQARLDSIITQQLLIQEAQRLRIDKEESFRKALKEYYENSLVKVLLDRKDRELEVSVEDWEIENYISLQGCTVSFTRLEDIPTTENLQESGGLTTTALFDDLASPIQLLLSTLEPGKFGLLFDTGHEKYAIRLNKISPGENKELKEYDKKYLREIIEDYKKEQLFNSWLAELIAKADITITTDQQQAK